jgi:hypothetical protein
MIWGLCPLGVAQVYKASVIFVLGIIAAVLLEPVARGFLNGIAADANYWPIRKIPCFDRPHERHAADSVFRAQAG